MTSRCSLENPLPTRLSYDAMKFDILAQLERYS